MPAINPIPEALSVVMVQFGPEAAVDHDSVNRNIERIENYTKRACASFPGVDLVVFPEYCTHGFGFDPYAHHLKLASTVPGPETDIYGRIARENNVWICVSMVERAKEKELNPYNAMVLINSDGEVALNYRKMIPWCPKEPWTPGDSMDVCDGPKGSKFAITLCSDLDYPETGREAAWKGANVILRPSKYMYPWDHIWGITNQVRAYENQAYVVALNHVGADNSYSYFGQSMACDFDGNIICQLGSDEAMTKVDLYPLMVEAAREKRLSNNYLYQLKHRGYTGLAPHGATNNPFTVYSDWDNIPERWNRAPNQEEEAISSAGRASLERAAASLSDQ